jgi:tripartite-type tricarboxylate transporter receptor subunit TctC
MAVLRYDSEVLDVPELHVDNRKLWRRESWMIATPLGRCQHSSKFMIHRAETDMLKRILLPWFLCAASLVQAQSYPAKPIRIISPFVPGDAADVIPRLIAPRLTEQMGQPVVVENRPGAGGMLGLDLIAKAAPDGYTIGVGQTGNMAVLPHTAKTIAYDPLKDLVPVALATTNYLAIVATPGAPFKNVGEMIAYARANAGKLTVATNGEGGFPHLSFELLRSAGGFSYTHVPYKGTGTMTTDLIGGQVMAGISGIGSLSAHIKAGRIRLLGITNRARVALLPDVEAVNEDVPGYEAIGWFGFVAPAGTPTQIVARLNNEINRALAHPEVHAKLVGSGFDVASASPADFANVVRTDFEKFGKLLQGSSFNRE